MTWKKSKKAAFASAILTAALLAGCAQKPLEYTITVTGDSVESGMIEFLDYNIMVYAQKREADCSNCQYAAVSLYAGCGAEDVTEAMKNVVEEANDLWEVVSYEGGTIVLREKEPGTVKEIGELCGPKGITMTGTTE
ncbi:MAG: hypothetical protein J6M22_02200 [Firmicutes bacterium]|nr:hypothetical protein [Bacillota bacterium]